MEAMPDESVELIVTSPPYPMIEMWDDVFQAQDPSVSTALQDSKGWLAFEAMHRLLDDVWKECYRVLRPGCLACINIGDATRTIDGVFCLYPNNARITSGMRRQGFNPLPDILWRKQTNAPNKFMGSGMLPAGAYVTYEHEYILIFRKGGKRRFRTPEEKANRRRSAYFWEERNDWFSDIWTDLKGASQDLVDPQTRKRSGAFPFELAYRLINMFSVYEDTVLDPFLGTGTTLVASAASARNGIGVEWDRGLEGPIRAAIESTVLSGEQRVAERLQAHRLFVEDRSASGKHLKHLNGPYGFPVITRQERELVLLSPTALREVSPHVYEVEYSSQEPRRQLQLSELTA